MRTKEYVKKKQPLLFRTFSYALKSQKLAHAYLLLGEPGTPLKETAIYLAKSILCDEPDPLACEECRTCRRVENGHYTDLIIVDGEKLVDGEIKEGSIKKDEITKVVESFNETSVEPKGIMVYVINRVENTTDQASNSLLKFLEEPTPNTYAILTTQNEAQVLPTIISRCQEIRLLLAPRKEVIEQALELGVALSDAEILSNFYNAGELVLEKSQNEDYQRIKDAFEICLNSLNEGPEKARFAFETSIMPLLSGSNGKSSAKFFFDILALAFEDMVSAKRGSPLGLTSYATIINSLSSYLPHVEESLLAIMTLRGEIDSNIKVGLLLTHLVNLIF